MTFNYRVLKEQEWVHERAHDVFKVITVYYDDESNITSWADTSNNSLVWATYDDLAGTAEYVMQAFKRPVLELHEDGQLIPMSAEAWPPPKKELYVVEYRDHYNNRNAVYYTMTWSKAVAFIDKEDNSQYRDDFYYAIVTQYLDEEADDLAEGVLFGKDGEPLGDESDE